MRSTPAYILGTEEETTKQTEIKDKRHSPESKTIQEAETEASTKLWQFRKHQGNKKSQHQATDFVKHKGKSPGQPANTKKSWKVYFQ